MSSSPYSDNSFDASALLFPFSPEKHKWICLDQEKDKKLYGLVTAYIPSHLVDEGKSYSASVSKAKSKKEASCCDSDTVSCGGLDLAVGRISLGIGYGQNSFYDFNGKKIEYVHQKCGKPIGTNCGVQIFTTLVLFTDSSIEELCTFLSKLIEESEKSLAGYFTCFAWHVKYQYWRKESRILARPVTSVVLPSATKKRLIDDLEKFLLPSTQSFYNRNGIPYRRSYLFYGLPGTGKTSMVQALAGHFNRSVCYLMPTHPEMTDDSLRTAVTELPEDAIVVFEDIDSLFAKDRSNKMSKSSLTFSGLLNALDGIGNPSGQIFILTTNLREQLDQALIRNGRVDMHIEFTYAVEEQMQQMWSNFYPSHTHLAEDFSRSLLKLLAESNMQVAASGLQHFFVTMMDCPAETALSRVENIISEIRENNSQAALEALKKPTEAAEDAEDVDEEEVEEGGTKGKKVGKKGGKKGDAAKKKNVGDSTPLAMYCLATAVIVSALYSHK